MRLDYSFVDKNKHVKKNIATSMENIAEAVDKDLDNKQREDFGGLLQAYTNILSKNLYFSTDYTYNNLKRLIKHESTVVIPGAYFSKYEKYNMLPSSNQPVVIRNS